MTFQTSKPSPHAFRLFQDHCNDTATPFNWTFSRNDLNGLVARIGRHEPDAPFPLAA